MKSWRSFRNPVEEGCEPGMRTQSFRCVEFFRQFSFAQRRVDFVVADLMDEACRPTFSASKFWHQMMLALLGFRGDRAQAKGTNRIAHV